MHVNLDLVPYSRHTARSAQHGSAWLTGVCADQECVLPGVCADQECVLTRNVCCQECVRTESVC